MATTALARRPQQQVQTAANEDSGIVAFRAQLEQRAKEFKMVLPSHITPEKFQRTVLTAVQASPAILTADRRSLITACMKAAQDGLLPDGREAALVTFNTRQKDGQGQWHTVVQVQYMPMVYGLRKKILQSGEIKDIQTAVVYRQEIEEGLFVYEEGTERMLRHKPLLDPSFDPTDDDIACAYSVATFEDGSKSFEVMRRADINKVRQASQTGAVGKTDRSGNPIPPKGPWVDWFSEMARKSVMRRHSKTLPMSGDLVDVEALDELEASRSSLILLDSEEGGEPKQIAPTREQTGGVYDPETGEVLRDDPEQDASEGEGENASDEGQTQHHSEELAEKIIDQAAKAGTIIDLNGLHKRHQDDIDAMPDEIAAQVNKALRAAEKRLTEER